MHFGYMSSIGTEDEFDRQGGSAAMVDANMPVGESQTLGLRTIGSGARGVAGNERYRVAYGPMYCLQLNSSDLQIAAGQFQDSTVVAEKSQRSQGLFALVGLARSWEVTRNVFVSWTAVSSWQNTGISRGAFIGLKVLTSPPRVTP